jgi:hypothetical protein
MLYISRDSKSGQAEYTFVATNARQERQELEGEPHNPDRRRLPPSPFKRKNHDSISWNEHNITQSFDLLLSNISSKALLAGYVMDTDRMREKFTSVFFKR